MLRNVPLLIVPFIVYNIQIFTNGEAIWSKTIFEVTMLRGGTWDMTMGDLMIVLGLILLYFEIIKATRMGANSIVDRLLATFVLFAYIIEFLMVPNAANSVFFILMVIALVDVLAGYTISLRSAKGMLM